MMDYKDRYNDVSISVVIPIYNGEKTIPECIVSILGQSLKGIEILCVDDGSQDASGALLDAYVAQDARFRVYHQPNRGVAMARNRAIALARGRFLAFMDPDDLYPSPDALPQLYAEAIRTGLPIVGGELERLAPDTGTISKPPLANTEPKGVHVYCHAPFDHGYTRFIYDRAWLVSHGIFFPPYIRFQDPPFLVQAMVTAGTYAMINTAVYRYRDNPKHVRWEAQDFERLRHLFLGMGEVARLAQKHSLPTLIVRLRQRLLVEWWFMFKPYHATILTFPEFDAFLQTLPSREARRIYRAFAFHPRQVHLERFRIMCHKVALVCQLCGWLGLGRIDRHWCAKSIDNFR